MGPEFLPPQDADSWGEFRARLEIELADGEPWLTVLRRLAGAALFVNALFSYGYAMTYHRPLLWASMLVSLTVLGAMAVGAVERADQRADRVVELNRLEEAWQEHLAQVPSSIPGPAKP